MPITRRLSSPVRVAALVTAVLLLTVVLVPPPAAAQAPAVRSPDPAPHAVVEAGRHVFTATVTGGQDAILRVDGTPVGPLETDGVGVDLTAGVHHIEVVVAGAVARAWTVYAAGVTTTELGADPLTVSRTASGPSGATRPVLLVNPDRPELALAAGPLGVATGALVVPTGQARVPDATLEAIAAVRSAGDEVLILGGLDAIGPDVAARLTQAGYAPDRVGSGTAVDVAAAAARRERIADVYTRGGQPVVRPVLVAPDEPLHDAIQGAADAAARGASLVLAGSDGIAPATAEVIADSRVVHLSHALTTAAADAARDAAGDATVRRVEARSVAVDDRVWVADAERNPGAAVLAARAARPGAHVLVDRAAATTVARTRPAQVTTVGDLTAGTVGAWWIDGPEAPMATTAVAEDSATVTVESDRPLAGAALHVTVHGVEWDGQTVIDGSRAMWTAGPRPDLPPDLEPSTPGPAPLVVTGVVTAGGHLRHVGVTEPVTIRPSTSTSPEGFTVAGGSSAVVGDGPLRTFSVEVEPSTGLDVGTVRAEVEEILLDPDRGWTARGQRSLQRVGSAAEATIRVVVATPATVDRFCARVGLNTGGRLSCWDGRRGMLNLNRWTSGVAPFHTDVTVYRRYLVSHEVGHGLGYGHVGCPAAGALAPVMMQQSKGLGACVANGWPYPHG